MVTVGVTDLADARATSLADAGMAFPADAAGVVTVGVASLADAGMLTVDVTDLADAGAVSLVPPLIFLMVRSIVVVSLVVVIGCRLESGADRGLRFRMTWIVSTLIM